jgi:hypothetical protein
MKEKVEGQFRLDGLLEGPLPDTPEVESQLRRWVESADSNGLQFHLDVDGGRFSLLPSSEDIPAKNLGENPSEMLCEALERLAEFFPPPCRRELTSTLRSIEYRPGTEVQTIYLLQPDGCVQPRQRQIEAETVAPPDGSELRNRLLLGLIGLLALLVILGISALFVDYPALLGDLFRNLRPLDPTKVEVQCPSFERFVEIVDKKPAPGRRSMVVTLRRTEEFPTRQEDIDRAMQQADGRVHQELSVVAMARGYVRCELFDREGQFIGFVQCRIKSLRYRSTAEIHLPLSRSPQLARVEITY